MHTVVRTLIPKRKIILPEGNCMFYILFGRPMLRALHPGSHRQLMILLTELSALLCIFRITEAYHSDTANIYPN